MRLKTLDCSIKTRGIMQGVRACTCTGSAYRGSTQHFPAQQRRVATKRVIAPRATASSSPEQQPKATPHPLTRRALVAGVTAGVPLFMSTAPALAVRPTRNAILSSNGRWSPGRLHGVLLV